MAEVTRFHRLHDEIVRDVTNSTVDPYEKRHEKYIGDPLQEILDLNLLGNIGKSRARVKYAFTEPYWRKWNNDLKILQSESAKSREQSEVTKTIPALVRKPQRHVESHQFGAPLHNRLQPNKGKCIKEIKSLRNCVGKDNNIPEPVDYATEPIYNIRGGPFSCAAAHPMGLSRTTCECEFIDLAGTHKYISK